MLIPAVPLSDDNEYIQAPDGEPASRRRLICLWRAVCCVAEHAFINEPADHRATAWAIPRPLLRGLENWITGDGEAWGALQDRYRAGESGAARLAIVWVAMTHAGERLLHAGADRAFCAGLAHEVGLPFGATHRAMRLLARHFLVGPEAMTAMIEIFGVGPWWFSVLPFEPLAARARLDATAEDIQRFLARVAAGTRAMPHPEAVALVQLAQHLNRPWSAIAALPPEILSSDAALRNSPYGLSMDMMLARLEALCDALDRLGIDIQAGDGDAAAAATEQAAALFSAHGSLAGVRDVAHLLDWRGDYAARTMATLHRLAAPLTGRLAAEGARIAQSTPTYAKPLHPRR